MLYDWLNKQVILVSIVDRYGLSNKARPEFLPKKTVLVIRFKSCASLTIWSTLLIKEGMPCTVGHEAFDR